MARRRRRVCGKETEIKIDERWKQRVPEKTLNRLLEIVRNWGFTNISTIKQLLKIVERCPCGRIYIKQSGGFGCCPVCAYKLMKKMQAEHPDYIGWQYFNFERLRKKAKVFKTLQAA
ncbi:hypothetical protein ES702_06184 [subsurface metagenome]